MLLKLSNWRCIESLELNLSQINIFIGKNSTGKSSLAYAVYLASRVSRGEDPDRIASQLIGQNFTNLARVYNENKAFPIEVCIEGDKNYLRISAKKDKPKPTIEKKGHLWSDEYLALSGRYGIIISYQILSNILSSLGKEAPQFVISLLGSLGEMLYRELPLTAPAPILINDLLKTTGVDALSLYREIKVKGLGAFSMFPLIQFITQVYTFYDVVNEKLRLPASQAPSGLVDSAIIRVLLEGAKEGSLIVIEEPEEHQNPISQIDIINYIVSKAKEKNLTIVITTHSEICILTIVKAVRDKILKPNSLSLYYLFERNKESPWTRLKEIKVLEDGTTEPLPDSIQVTVGLF